MWRVQKLEPHQRVQLLGRPCFTRAVLRILRDESRPRPPLSTRFINLGSNICLPHRTFGKLPRWLVQHDPGGRVREAVARFPRGQEHGGHGAAPSEASSVDRGRDRLHSVENRVPGRVSDGVERTKNW